MVSKEKSFKVVKFTGEDFNFRGCSANRKGYRDLLESKLKIPTKTEYDVTEG